MSLFKKMVTALRGGATEVGEAVVDSQSMRIYAQEIKDSEERLVKAKKDLTSLVAQETASAREVSRIKSSISEHEGYAVSAMEKNNNDLALKVAEKIADFENQLISANEIHANNTKSVSRLKEMVKKTEREISEHKRQLQMVKTTESVQKATAAASTHLSSGANGLSDAKSSLERIKARQQKQQDEYDASEKLNSEGDELANQLKEAGITGSDNNANSVLERLKKKQAE